MMRFAGTCALLISMSLILPSSASVISNKQTANVDAQTAMVETAPKCISKKTLVAATATTVALVAGAYYFNVNGCQDNVKAVYKACYQNGQCISKVKSVMSNLDISSLPDTITAIPSQMKDFVTASCDFGKYKEPVFAMKRAGAAMAALVGLTAVFGDCGDSEPKQVRNTEQRQYRAEAAPVKEVSPQSAAERKTLQQKVEKVQRDLDIPFAMVQDLLAWAGTKIIVVADDSTSMTGLASINNGKVTSRWEELKEKLSKLSEILEMVGSDGFDLFFLNANDQGLKIHSKKDVQMVFNNRSPSGGTPLYREIKKAIQQRSEDVDTLVMVMTDGLPSDASFSDVQSLIQHKPKNVYFSFMMCTDDDELVEEYNEYIDPIPGVDVCDDYHSEKKECLQNAGIKMNFNMYLTKAVIGPKFPKWDNLDEKPRTGLFW